MSTYGVEGLNLKGQVQRSYTIQAPPEICYEYLSDLKNLLSQVPFVTKIQIGKTSGRARAFFNLAVLALSINAVLDLEPVYDKPALIIRLQNAEQSLGPIPPNHYTCSFQCFIKIAQTERGNSRVTSQLSLGFDGAQMIERGLISRQLLETSGPLLLQQYCERLCDDYILNLMDSFRKWQAARPRS